MIVPHISVANVGKSFTVKGIFMLLYFHRVVSVNLSLKNTSILTLK